MAYTYTHTIEPQDEAMDAFRSLFAHALPVLVSPDGMHMTIQTGKDDRKAATLFLDAFRIVTTNQLPLIVETNSNLEVDRWGMCDRFYIVVRFAADRTELPCY